MSKTLEELGYEKRKGDYGIEFKKERRIIYFYDYDNINKFACFNEWNRSTYECLSMEELKAIYKWCEDNNWI